MRLSWCWTLIFLATLGRTLAGGVEEWDLAEDLRLLKLDHPAVSAPVNLAHGLRRARHSLEFKSMGNAFSLDLDCNDNLIDRNLRDSASHRPMIGRNLRVTKEDGMVDYIESPLARFIIEEDAGKLTIMGGFQYEDHFYQLKASDSLMLSNEISCKAAARRSQDKSSVIVTRRTLERLNDGPNGEKRRCGTDRLEFNKRQSGSFAKPVQPHSSGLINKLKQNDRGRISRTLSKSHDAIAKRIVAGCPAQPHQLTVAIVADCNYVKALGGPKKARENILNDMNLVAGIFEQNFNLDLTLNSVELLEKCDNGNSFNVPCKEYPGFDEALNLFSKWRDGRNADAGIYHLVTACNYSETVGLAWVNQVCRTSSFTDSMADTVSGTSMTVIIPNQFSIIAHELGHNLGAIHDCDRSNCDGTCKGYLECQCCPCDGCDCKGKYIMDSQSGGVNSVNFSKCSIKDVCDKLPYLGTCLKEQGEKTKDLAAVCGNGIKEGDEECDCGGEEGCAKTKCCTTNCKLTAGSACYNGNDKCCQDNCQLVPADDRKVCRVANSGCQEDSYCDGLGPACPKSTLKLDGVTCGDGKKCASGVCTSRDLQCSIFGRHLNITQACKYTRRSCSVICQDSEQCIDMNAHFVDGTGCGEKGYCNAGMCSEFGSQANPNSVRFPWATVAFKTIISIAAFLAAWF